MKPPNASFSLRRSTCAVAALLLVAAAGRTAPASSSSDEGAIARTARLPVASVGPVGMTVSDLDAAVRFYTNVLAFDAVSEVEVDGRAWELLHGVFGARMRVARLRLGAEEIELTEYLAPKGRPFPADIRPNDAIFQHIAIIVSDLEEGYRHLRRHGVQHGSTGPVRLPDWNPNAGGIQAFYFRDPDGHFLELLQFPADKGDDRWHARDRLFLGIDHTAIVSGDTDRSLAFYRDTLGLRVAGESENFDVEQEHLNNVFGARLRITALRAAAGPAVELLEYLAPGTGRPAPHDLAANDVAHWHTTMTVPRPADAITLARRKQFRLVSPVEVAVETNGAGFSRGVLVRDPDGHGVRLVR